MQHGLRRSPKPDSVCRLFDTVGDQYATSYRSRERRVPAIPCRHLPVPENDSPMQAKTGPANRYQTFFLTGIFLPQLWPIARPSISVGVHPSPPFWLVCRTDNGSPKDGLQWKQALAQRKESRERAFGGEKIYVGSRAHLEVVLWTRRWVSLLCPSFVACWYLPQDPAGCGWWTSVVHVTVMIEGCERWRR